MNSKSPKRKKTPISIETDVLTKSRRRCPLCIYLNNDISEKKGQIAHIDHNPSNIEVDNLVFLCLEHHNDYDSKASQAKGYQENEIKKYRDLLYSNISNILLKSGKRIDIESELSTADNMFIIQSTAGIDETDRKLDQNPDIYFKIKSSSDPNKLDTEMKLFKYNCVRIEFFKINNGILQRSQMDSGNYSGFKRLNVDEDQIIKGNLSIPPGFSSSLKDTFLGVEICRYPPYLQDPKVSVPKLFHFNESDEDWEGISSLDSYKDVIWHVKEFQGIQLQKKEALALEAIYNLLDQENKEKFKSLSFGQSKDKKIGFVARGNHVFEINLNSCNIDVIPNEIGDLPWLRYLDLRGNSIDSLPREISNCKNLEWIDISYNNIKDINMLSELPNITSLIARYNQIEQIPTIIGGWDSLNSLKLEHNNIQIIPDSMQKLSSLKDLQLYENNIKKIPTSFLKLNLDSLHIQKNPLNKDDNFHKLHEKMFGKDFCYD